MTRADNIVGTRTVEDDLVAQDTEYLRHYNTARPHRSLDLQPPHPAPRLALVEPDTVKAPVQRVDVLGGLIHEYHRAA